MNVEKVVKVTTPPVWYSRAFFTPFFANLTIPVTGIH